jgi:hypothetical protein
MREWPEPVWFQDNENGSADDNAGDFRNVSTISRAQLLLQYLLAIDVSPLESR